MKNCNLKMGIFNPLNCKKIHFSFEVVEDGEDVITKEYEYEGCTYTYQEKTILIKSLGGNISPGNKFIVSVINNDALKPLRKGELISVELSFHVIKDEEGNYQQEVRASDIYTLNDYYQLREADAAYKGKFMKKTEESA